MNNMNRGHMRANNRTSAVATRVGSSLFAAAALTGVFGLAIALPATRAARATPTSSAARTVVVPNVKIPFAAPELVGLKNWVNSAPRTLASLRGKVVLVNFWTFGCVNCQNTLPHVKALYAKYHAKGLEIIGVHAPEFGYEKDAANVRKAVARDGIEWPVAQDNSFSTWNEYRNQFWPAFYYVDRAGKVRHFYAGEGSYATQDAVVAALLAESA